MKKQIFLMGFLVSLAFGFKDISADEVAMFASSGDALIVDVRTKEEWEQTGVLQNATLITYFDNQARALKDEFMKSLNEVTKGDKNKQIVLVCRTGLRSKLVAGILDREGYKNVYNYKDGMLNWLVEGRAVVKKWK
ncbi:MAG: rhodanese-like domain-containing protein [Campylobacteraceae bacterium]|nr:rhodanese-like domain-containing protein [Campylobacteraceae bacterium]